MSKALYRKYRSKSLQEIVGQQHVTDVLARALKQGRVAHAYLLTGPRGVGKTSIARILAHEINGLPYEDESNHLDIIEIDAASNNGVEDVRDLREKVQIAPVSAKHKVYIIDEVHMLSKAAFNALLKTLEEPPEHAVFILATTDADKLPATIISRTQRFNFRLISPSDAVKHLRHIADQEKIKIDDDALELIAQRGEGSFRDSISLLDQLQSLADKKTGITSELVEQSLGLAPREHVEKLLAAYEAKDLSTIVQLLDESDQSGVQSTVLMSQLIQTVRGLVATKPHLLPLLDQLLDVAKSPQPNIKLLTVLGSHAVPKPKSAALSSTPAEISAPIKELETRAVEQKPFASSPTATEKKAVEPPAVSSAQTSAARVSAVHATETRHEAISKDNGSEKASGTKPDVSSHEKATANKSDLKDFDWQKLVEHTRGHYVAIFSVINKCHHAIDGGTLVIYTGTNFWKKKLDDSKHRVNLSKALEEIGFKDTAIETIGTPPPPKDSQAAAVAAIMGGGEEVSVDDTSAS